MGVGDGADDRQAEPGARAVGVALQALERLGEAADVLGPDHRTGVLDTRTKPGRVVTRTLPPMTLWRTAFSTRLATRRSISGGSPVSGAAVRSVSTVTPRAAASAAVVSAGGAGGDGEVDRLAARQHLLAAGQHHQRVEQHLRAVGGLEHRLAHLAQVGDVGVRVGERDLDLGADDRQRRAQLVRGIGDEAALAVERAGEPVEHPVDRVGELAQLVVRALHARSARPCRSCVTRWASVVTRRSGASARSATR